MSTDWIATLSALAGFCGLLVFSAWKAGRPRPDSLRARWISWRFLVLLSGTCAFLVLVHAVNLLGVRTG
jgi:hypothetical protein